jgi:hypothetical protein
MYRVLSVDVTELNTSEKAQKLESVLEGLEFHGNRVISVTHECSSSTQHAVGVSSSQSFVIVYEYSRSRETLDWEFRKNA